MKVRVSQGRKALLVQTRRNPFWYRQLHVLHFEHISHTRFRLKRIIMSYVSWPTSDVVICVA